MEMIRKKGEMVDAGAAAMESKWNEIINIYLFKGICFFTI